MTASLTAIFVAMIPLAVSGASFGAAGFLLVTDSLAGFLLYAHLLRRAAIATVSTYAYATPVIAAALGFTVLGEPFWWGAVGGGALVLAAQLRGAA